MSTSTSRLSVRDALFEKPGPKAEKRIKIATVISVAALAVLLILMVRQFYITGQLQAKYWSFFLKYTTWRFLGTGLLGTIEVAAIGGVLALIAGFVLMLGRISRYKVFDLISVVIIEFTRGVPTLLFIYFSLWFLSLGLSWQRFGRWFSPLQFLHAVLLRRF